MNKTKLTLSFIVVIFGYMLYPEYAYADAGVPMIYLTYPAMLIALVPIIVLESIIFEKTLHLGYRKTAWRVGLANAVSTIGGFPLTWFLMMLFQMSTGGGGFYSDTLWGNILAVTWQAPWLMPHNNRWMVPTAAFVGLIPAFFASVGVEGLILKGLFRKTDIGANLWPLTWKANQVSYIILGGIPLILLASSLIAVR